MSESDPELDYREKLPRYRAAGIVEIWIQAAAAALDPDVPAPLLQPLTDTVDARRGAWTILARLMSVLALVSTLLACVGLGALISAGVIARIREVGIRVLGATPGRVVAFVMRRTILVTVAGLFIGSAAGVGLAQVLRNRVVGVGPFDVWSWVFAVTGVVAIAIVASWLPVRRAVRLDVTRTLRV